MYASERFYIKSDTITPQPDFKFYRKEIDLFLVPPSVMRAYVYRYDKYDLLSRKISLYEKQIEVLSKDSNLKQQKIDNLQLQNDNQFESSIALREALQKTEDQLSRCNDLNGIGELSIQSLQLQLNKERVKYTWYSIGGGTMAAAALLLITEIVKK